MSVLVEIWQIPEKNSQFTVFLPLQNKMWSAKNNKLKFESETKSIFGKVGIYANMCFMKRNIVDLLNLIELRGEPQ